MVTSVRLHLCGSYFEMTFGCHGNHPQSAMWVNNYIANLERNYKMLLKLQPVLLQSCVDAFIGALLESCMESD